MLNLMKSNIPHTTHTSRLEDFSPSYWIDISVGPLTNIGCIFGRHIQISKSTTNPLKTNNHLVNQFLGKITGTGGGGIYLVNWSRARSQKTLSKESRSSSRKNHSPTTLFLIISNSFSGLLSSTSGNINS